MGGGCFCAVWAGYEKAHIDNIQQTVKNKLKRESLSRYFVTAFNDVHLHVNKQQQQENMRG